MQSSLILAVLTTQKHKYILKNCIIVVTMEIAFLICIKGHDEELHGCNKNTLTTMDHK